MSESELNGDTEIVQAQPEHDAAVESEQALEQPAKPVTNADWARERIIAKKEKENQALKDQLAEMQKKLADTLEGAATRAEVERIKAEAEIEKTRILTLAQEGVPMDLLPFIKGGTPEAIKEELNTLRGAFKTEPQPPAAPASTPSVSTPPKGETRPDPVAGTKRIPTKAEYAAMSPEKKGQVAQELIDAGISELPD